MNAAQRLLNMECPKGPVDLVIDSDTWNEIDDQFAISYALHASEKLRVRALYAAPLRTSGPPGRAVCRPGPAHCRPGERRCVKILPERGSCI